MPIVRSHCGLAVIFLASLFSLSCGPSNPNAAAPPAGNEKPEEHHDDVVTLTAEEIKSSGIVVAAVGEGSVAQTISIQGRVIPRSTQRAVVISPFPGRLQAAPGGFPLVGSFVHKGQLLATVEQELAAAEATAVAEKLIDLDSQVEQAQHDVAQRTRDVERARALYEGGVIALKQLQQAETDLNIAEARLRSAQRGRASYAALVSSSEAGPRRIPLTAPIDGRIIAVNASPDQRVDNARPVFEIADLAVVWVEAQVFEEHLTAVKRAHKVEITARAAGSATFAGKLINATHQIDPVNKTEGVIFEVANTGGVLALGMNVEVLLPSGAESTGPVVPASAIIEMQGRSIVFVERKPGDYERRDVKIGTRSRDRAVILEGLAAGERVVTTGAQVLANPTEAGGEEK